MSSNRWMAASRCYSVTPSDQFAQELLGRSPNPVDLEVSRSELANATVLVTGGGGFIGAELSRAAAAFGAHVIAADMSEYALSELQDVTPVLLDVRDHERVDRLLDTYRPTYVFHAAAYKHVPFLETRPIEAVENNVLATWHLAEACRRHNVGNFIFVSSDKAAAAANILGASKRIAEMLLSSMPCAPTHFVSVRCANVLGSPGSIVPRALDQIAQGGPVTLTSATASRYFMTLKETSALVLHAASLNDPGAILVPHVGEPVRIADLLNRLIGTQLIDVVLTGMRPGDQEQESLVSDSEHAIPGACGRLSTIRNTNPLQRETAETIVEQLSLLCRNRDETQLRQYLQFVLSGRI